MKPTHLIVTTTLAAGLILTGCKDKGKVGAPGQNALPSAQALKAQIKKNMTPAAAVDSSKSEAAIAYMKAEGLSWERQTGENGSYQFSNLKFAEEDVTIDQLEISGLTMIEEDTPYATHITLKGLKAKDGGIDEIVLNLPSETTLDALQALENTDDPQAFMNAIGSSFMSYSGGGYMQGMRFDVDNGSDGVGSMGFMGWSKDGEAMSFLLEDMQMNTPSQADEMANFKIGHLSATGLKIGQSGEGQNSGGMAVFMQNYMALVNPYKRGYESFAVRDIVISGKDAGTEFNVEIPRGDIWYTEDKGGVYHNKVDFPEIKFTLPESEMNDLPEGAYETFGLDNMVMQYWGDIRIDRNKDNLKLLTGGIGLKDNFSLDISYDVDGMSGYFKAIDQMAANMGEAMEATMMDPSASGLGGMTTEMGENIVAEMSKMTFNEMVIEFRDQSFLEKGFKFAAEQQGQQVTDLKAAAKGALTLGTSAASTDYQRTLTKDFMSAAHSFIDNGGAVRFSMKPQGGFKADEAIQMFEQNAGSENPNDIMDKVLQRMNIDFEHVPG